MREKVVHHLPQALGIALERPGAGVDERFQPHALRAGDGANGIDLRVHDGRERGHTRFVDAEAAGGDARDIVHFVDEAMLLAACWRG